MKNNGIVRTTMAGAFMEAIDPEKLRGRKLSRVANKVIHRVLTDNAMGVGVKFDPARKRKPKVNHLKAVSAVSQQRQVSTVEELKQAA